jgi:tRNA A-37 threonylcarbamoyl transferase component Bud32
MPLGNYRLFILECFRALYYLSINGIHHLNLKQSNILLVQQYYAISDADCANSLATVATNAVDSNTYAETLFYRAPELKAANTAAEEHFIEREKFINLTDE